MRTTDGKSRRRGLRDLPLSIKLQSLVVLTLAALAVMASVAVITQYDRMREDRITELHAAIDVARSFAESLDADVTAGKLTKPEAIELFRRQIDHAFYGHKDYYFVYTMDGTIVARASDPENEGKNLIDFKDKSGRLIIRDQAELAQKGGGPYTVYWTRPGETEPVEKVNYVAEIPWDMWIGTGVFMDDLGASVRNTLMHFIAIAAAVGAVASLIVWLVARGIATPLRRLERDMTMLASGNLSIEIADTERRDEVGRMVRSVAVFKTNALEKQRLETQRQNSEAAAAAERRRFLESIADQLHGKIGSLTESLSTASQRLKRTAETMSAAAAQSDRQSLAISSAVGQAAVNVETVATAAAQLTSSIHEIARQVEQSSAIAGRAVDDARRTDAIVHELSESAQKIGRVVELINEIAGQTSLLALNATIEAARAGDAGRGFAVVASEVKALANQTARAIDDIGGQITQIQTATTEAVGAIEAIAGTIGDISTTVSTISAAIEEQQTATREISRNAEEASRGTEAAGNNVTGIREAVTRTAGASGEVLSAAQELANQSEALSQELVRVIGQIRAA
jgi:methyl-accepting chemotaxis protein